MKDDIITKTVDGYKSADGSLFDAIGQITSMKIGNKTYTIKPLTMKQWGEVSALLIPARKLRLDRIAEFMADGAYKDRLIDELLEPVTLTDVINYSLTMEGLQRVTWLMIKGNDEFKKEEDFLNALTVADVIRMKETAESLQVKQDAKNAERAMANK